MKSLLLVGALMFAPVNANDTTITEPITTEQITIEDTTSSEQTIEEEVKEVEQGILDFIKENFNSTLIMALVNWAIDVGLLTAIAVIVVKTRKYKHYTGQDLNNNLKKELNACFKELSKEEIAKLINANDKTQQALKTIIKALCLAQDKTAEGKKALVDLMIEVNENVLGNDKETKELLQNTKTSVQKEQTKTEKINEKVKDTYTPID